MFVLISQRDHLHPFYRMIEDANDEGKITPQVYRMLEAVNTPFEKIINWIWKKTEIRFVHISQRDLISLDYTLSNVIYPALLRYQKGNTISTPLVDCEDVPEELSYEKNNVENFHEAPTSLVEKRWEHVLGKIIFAFEKIKEDQFVEYRDEINIGTQMFGKYYNDFWI